MGDRKNTSDKENHKSQNNGNKDKNFYIVQINQSEERHGCD